MEQQRRTATGPVTILAIADEERPALTVPGGVDFGAGNRPDLLLSAGDLDFGYVAAVADAFDVPCAMVPGNHDPSLEGFTLSAAGWIRAGRHDVWPGPAGAWAADRDVVEVAGLRIAGLGGCGRYSAGPNQWTNAQAMRRARRVLRRARRSPAVDVLLTHAPGTPGAENQGASAGGRARLGGSPVTVRDHDTVHRALPAVDMLAERLRPALHLHGHVHLHGADRRVTSLPSGDSGPGTLVVNTVGWTLTRVHPGPNSNSVSGPNSRTDSADPTPRAELILKGR
ncbi:metallophosphoesterase [Corynebacterium sp. NPDC060344]|uniref:metallophosphoesterase family protein n=1 Tax=Corynebacterium sp. NPDC060344 TaxID=3347101 RepID=UPI003661D52A